MRFIINKCGLIPSNVRNDFTLSMEFLPLGFVSKMYVNITVPQQPSLTNLHLADKVNTNRTTISLSYQLNHPPPAPFSSHILHSNSDIRIIEQINTLHHDRKPHHHHD